MDRLLRVLCLLEDCNPVRHDGVVGLGFFVEEQVDLDEVALAWDRLVSLGTRQGREAGGGLPSLKLDFISGFHSLSLAHRGNLESDLENTVTSDEEIAPAAPFASCLLSL